MYSVHALMDLMWVEGGWYPEWEEVSSRRRTLSLSIFSISRLAPYPSQYNACCTRRPIAVPRMVCWTSKMLPPSAVPISVPHMVYWTPNRSTIHGLLAALSALSTASAPLRISRSRASLHWPPAPATVAASPGTLIPRPQYCARASQYKTRGSTIPCVSTALAVVPEYQTVGSAI
eukprot:1877725-Rhodomonas_salina.2